MSLICTVNEILSLVSQNLRRSRDTSLSGIIYHACTSTPTYKQQTKFEVCSFTDSIDIIGAKFKKTGNRDSDHAH